MTAQVVHHFPPELFDLLVDAIPRLLKGKQNVLDFFKSCGVPGADYSLLQRQVLNEKTGGPKISKFEIARQVLRTLNDLGDARLRERREVVRRVAQWDDFTRSYENDRAAAEGFVARIQKLVNTKDSFTRMNETAERAQAEIAEEAHGRIPSCLINTCDCAIMVMSHLHPMPRSGTLQPVYFCEVREVPHRERHKYPSIAEMDMVNPVNHCYFFNPSYHATLPSQRR